MFNKKELEDIVKNHPDSFPARKLLENFHLFERIYEVVNKKFMYGCGSYLIDGFQYRYCPSMLKKQEELYRFAMDATNVLEIGVYLGHSLLIMLLANPKLKITAIDYDKTFAEPVISYLNVVFGERITFINSDAIEALKKLSKKEFDLIHIDSDHNDKALTQQFDCCLPLARDNCIFIFDDYDAVKKTIDNLINHNILEKIIIPYSNYRNCITRLLSTNEKIIRSVSPFSACSKERLSLNIKAIETVNEQNILGDIVEIGVYKGGSIMSMILSNTNENRVFWLYDTFEGMTEPSSFDYDLNNYFAKDLMEWHHDVKCISKLEDVKNNINKHTNITNDKINYIVGDIRLNKIFPKKIAVLRLDTDFYDSTIFELNNFYDLVSSGGYIIIDDYGHWQGCRKAVDEFLLKYPDIKLHKIDYTGVYFIKP